MLKMVDGTGIIGVDMVCPLGGAVSPPQPPNYDNIEMEGVGSLMLPNSLKAPIERLELIGNSTQFTTTGARLTPLSQDNLYNKDGLTAVMNPDGSVKIIGTPTKQFASVMAIEIIGLEAGTYYISGGSINDGKIVYQCNITRADGSREYFFNGLMELKSDDQYRLYLLTYNSSNLTEVNDTIYPMLNKGSKALPFEPYTGGNPSPSPEYPQEIKSAGKWNEGTQKYEVDVKVTGKNLLSNKPTDWQIGKRISWSGYPEGAITIYPVIKNAVNVISLKPLTAYSIINNSGGIVINRIVERGLNKNGIKDHDVRSSKYTLVTNQNTMNAILQFEKVDGTELLSTDIESIKIMLVEGEVNEPTPYEPYTEQSMQIALDEPLRGIGEYKDTITKDGVVRKIAHEVGNINCEFYDFVVDENFYKIVFTPKYAPKNDKYYTIQCNISPHMAIYEGNPLIYWLPTTEEIKGMGIDIKGTMKDANAKLLDYLSKNPIELQYGLKTPVTEPLPESVQAQLQALHSENGTTHVFVDSGEVPCGIKLTYRKEK